MRVEPEGTPAPAPEPDLRELLGQALVQIRDHEERLARMERLLLYVTQVLGVNGPPGEIDPEAQHRRFEVLRGRR